MKLFRKEDVDHAQRNEGSDQTENWYYKPDGYEVIWSVVKPGTMQPLHKHQRIVETYVVAQGEITIVAGDGEDQRRTILHEGEFAEIAPGECHAVENHSSTQTAIMVVLKLVHPQAGTPDVFKTDKYSCNNDVRKRTAEQS